MPVPNNAACCDWICWRKVRTLMAVCAGSVPLDRDLEVPRLLGLEPAVPRHVDEGSPGRHPEADGDAAGGIPRHPAPAVRCAISDRTRRPGTGTSATPSPRAQESESLEIPVPGEVGAVVESRATAHRPAIVPVAETSPIATRPATRSAGRGTDSETLHRVHEARVVAVLRRFAPLVVGRQEPRAGGSLRQHRLGRPVRTPHRSAEGQVGDAVAQRGGREDRVRRHPVRRS